MVGLTGRKLAWCNVGDASIQLFRPAPGEGRLRCVFSTVEQRSTVRTASGQEIQMPLQLGCYSHADQTVEHAVKSMEGANFGIMTPEVGDIILVCSDGVTDNLGGNLLVRSLEALLVAPRDAPCTRIDRDAPCTRIDRDAPCTRILWLLDGFEEVVRNLRSGQLDPRAAALPTPSTCAGRLYYFII